MVKLTPWIRSRLTVCGMKTSWVAVVIQGMPAAVSAGVPLRGRDLPEHGGQRRGRGQLLVGRDPPPARHGAGRGRGDPGAGGQLGALPGRARQGAGGRFQGGQLRRVGLHAGHVQRGGGQLDLGAQHEHGQALDQRRGQVLAHQGVQLRGVLGRGGAAPHHQGRQQAALGGAVAGQAGGIGGQAGDVLGQLAVQKGQRVGAAGAENGEIVQRRQLRATFGARRDRRMESMHGCVGP